MTAYINGELSQSARRYVARQIDRDPRCHAEYLRQRAIKDALESRLPAMDRPHADQLNTMWANIQTQLHDGAIVPVGGPANTPEAQSPYSLGYALAVLLCLFGLLLPFTSRVEGSEAAVIEQPVPALAVQQITLVHDTPDVASSLVAAARWTQPGSTPAPIHNLHSTPSPQTPEK